MTDIKVQLFVNKVHDNVYSKLSNKLVHTK